MSSITSPRKAPRQARSQATVDAILDATARVLVERGYASTSTNAVAAVAGVSVGSLYQYFPNKDALVSALHVRHMRQMEAVIDAAFARPASDSLEAALTGVIEGAIEAHRVEAELHRVLESHFFPRQIVQEQCNFDDTLQQRVQLLLGRYQDQITLRNPQLAIFMLMHSVHALIHAAVLELPQGLSLKAATDEIVHMVHAYLTAPLPAAPQASPVRAPRKTVKGSRAALTA